MTDTGFSLCANRMMRVLSPSVLLVAERPLAKPLEARKYCYADCRVQYHISVANSTGVLSCEAYIILNIDISTMIGLAFSGPGTFYSRGSSHSLPHARGTTHFCGIINPNINLLQ